MFRLAICTALACFAAPTAAGAATTVGPSPANPEPSGAQAVNQFPGTTLFTASAPPNVQLASPISGVVTRWNLYTDLVGATVTVQLRVLAAGAGTTFTPVASGPVEPVAQVSPTGAEAKNVLHTFPAHVAIAAGQTVGFSIDRQIVPGSFFEPVLPASPSAEWKYGSGTTVADKTTGTATLVSENWVAMNAEVEPDADGDLYGDESQDNCPGIANPSQADADGDHKGDACDSSTGGSAPDTKIGKAAKKFTAKGAKAKVKLKFSSTVAGSSFECKLDGKKYAACKSPKTYRVKPGRHTFRVRAKAAGIVDPTPAVKKFKVLTPRR